MAKRNFNNVNNAQIFVGSAKKPKAGDIKYPIIVKAKIESQLAIPSPAIIATKSRRKAPSKAETFDNLLPELRNSIEDESKFDAVIKKYDTAKCSSNAYDRREAAEFIAMGQSNKRNTAWTNDEYDLLYGAVQWIIDPKHDRKCKNGLWKTVQIIMQTDRSVNAIRVKFDKLCDGESKTKYRHSEFVKLSNQIRKCKAKTAVETR